MTLSMSLEEFKTRVSKVKEIIEDRGFEHALIVHHDDADGLCSGAIVKVVLERLGMRTELICIEKLLPQVITKIHSRENDLIVYCDIGSPHAHVISKENTGRNLVVILDHHDPSKATDEMVIDLNLELFGFKGERDFSGATCCYLFAKELSRENVDLSYLAVVGSQEIPGELKSLNKSALDDALKSGTILKERGKLIVSKFRIPVKRMFSNLQVLGAVGYYIGGPEEGVHACIHGFTKRIEDMVKELEEKRKKINRRVLSMIYRGGLRKLRFIQWIDVGEMYKGMGTKVIGTLCSFLTYRRGLIDENKYLVGLMNMEPVIPKLCRIEENYVKVSIRVPKTLREYIDSGKYPTAVDLLRTSTNGFGIAVDGHEYAASCIIDASKKHHLIRRMDEYVSEYLTTHSLK